MVVDTHTHTHTHTPLHTHISTCIHNVAYSTSDISFCDPQFMQGFGIKFLTKRFNDNLLIKCSLALTTLCYFLLVSSNTAALHLGTHNCLCMYVAALLMGLYVAALLMGLYVAALLMGLYVNSALKVPLTGNFAK